MPEFPYNKNLCYRILKDKDKSTVKKNNSKKSTENFEGLCSSVGLTEEFRIRIDDILQQLQNSSSLEYVFPESLTNEQRKYVHLKCRASDVSSKSQGKEPSRRLRIWRANKTYDKVFSLHYNKDINEHIDCSLLNYNTAVLDGSCLTKNYRTSPQNDQVFGRLSCGNPVTIPAVATNSLTEFRSKLPVWVQKSEIVNLLENNQVVIISSETGSGKTTQIPQYILENSCARGTSCKVICTQPRRLSTIAVAERVAKERGEKVGETVGYQIKLETRVGAKSALIYCTNGILLRTLMNSAEEFLQRVTHIIVDEIHERDKYTDFLLISLKRCLFNYPNLKIVLMSATLNVNQFMAYFPSSKLLSIPGKLFHVQECFLEEILISLDKNSSNGNSPCNGSSNILYDIDEWNSEYTNINCQQRLSQELECDETYQSLMQEMNIAVNSCVEDGFDECFQQLMTLILSEDANVNHQTPNEGHTPLIAAAIHGNMEIARQLLYLGANTSIKSLGLTAAEWADYYCKNDMRNLINQYTMPCLEKCSPETSETMLENNYECPISNETIDFRLIVSIIRKIQETDNMGTILIFLPGYEDITNCAQAITTSLNVEKIEIFMLHSSMNIKSQHRVFDVIKNKQKIILSTNIAETSITIADVVHVIDSGRAKEKTYDSISGTCSLQTVWISKASVRQRAGRAGRTQAGVCYHLFSRKRFMSMLTNRIPEMLRVPLHELCLQTKLLAHPNSKISDYLELALEPPPALSVENAIRGLKELGALKANEELTPLGEHLVQLSLEPRLGKMLLYAVVFKCLDPVMTIVACLASKDPFILPQNPRQKQLATQKQRQLAGNSLSDHLAFLRAYQLWQQAVSTGEENIVANFFINSATMQTIHDTRTQLLSQLRGAGFVNTQKHSTIQELNVHANRWPLIKAVLSVGCYPNVSFGQNGKFTTRMEKKVSFHKCSCLNNFTCDKSTDCNEIQNYCVVFEELSKIGKHCSIKCGSVVTPLTIALLCGDETKLYDAHSVTVDTYLKFQHGYDKLAPFCLSIRQIINRKIANPYYKISFAEQEILNALEKILFLEERQHELLFEQPEDVGLVPRMFPTQQFFARPSHQRRNSNNRQRETRQMPRRSNYSRNNFASDNVLDMQFNDLSIDLSPSTSSRVTNNEIARRGIFHQNEDTSNNLSNGAHNVELSNNLHSFPVRKTYPGKKEDRTSPADMLLNGINGGSLRSPLLDNVSTFQNSLSTENIPGLQINSGRSEILPLTINDVNVSSSAYVSSRPLRSNLSGAQNDFRSNMNTQPDTRPLGNSIPGSQNDFLSNANTQTDSRGNMLLAALGSRFSNYRVYGPLNSSDIMPLDRWDLPQQSVFFIIKPPDCNKFRMGISQSTWVFSPQTERKIFRYHNQGYCVVLFYTICKTQDFQGLAILTGTKPDGTLECPIQWLKTTSVPYQRIRWSNLKNSYNNNLLVFQCVDGQEVDHQAGTQLCNMFFQPTPENEREVGRPIRGSYGNN